MDSPDRQQLNTTRLAMKTLLISAAVTVALVAVAAVGKAQSPGGPLESVSELVFSGPSGAHDPSADIERNETKTRKESRGYKASQAAKANPLHFKAYTHRIVVGKALCGATAVSPHTLLTAGHCYTPLDTEIMIDGEDYKIVRAEVDGSDHALLVVDKHFDGWATLGPTPTQGAELSIFGNVDGFNQLLRRGYFAGYYEGKSRPAALFLDMNIGHGDSGSGLFNREGKLVGVISAVRVSEDSMANFTVAYTLSFNPAQKSLFFGGEE